MKPSTAWVVGVLLAIATSTGAQNLTTASESGDLAVAKALYAGAAYEEALEMLPDRPATFEQDVVDQYRALCLLALGKTADAEQAFERLVARNPLVRLSDEEVSPRVIELFHGVRRRILPVRAESLYARAKADLEDRQYTEASTKFAEVMLITADADVAGNTRMADLRIVAEEFYQLAEERRATTEIERRPASLAASGARAAGAPAPGTGDTDAELFDMLDAAVKPPVEISRVMPPWNPPREVSWRSFRGVIELVIDEDGQVDRARLVERIAPFYDQAIVEAAYKWRFEPALRDGKPVRFRHLVQLILRPGS
jgi:TonB family protein